MNTQADLDEGRSSTDDRPFVVPVPRGRRRAAEVGALALATALIACFAAGCGDGDRRGAPAEPSAPPALTSPSGEGSDFCAVYLAPPADTTSSDVDVAVAAEHAWAADLDRVGPPAGLGSDARRGFTAFVDALAHLTAADLREQADLDEQFGDDADDVRVFIGYAATVCSGG